jgi:hypothetical protein
MFGKTIHAAQFLFFSHFGPQTVSLDQSVVVCFLFPSQTVPSSISVQVAEAGMLPHPAQQPRNSPDAINLNPTWSRTHYQLQQPITIQPNYPIRPTPSDSMFRLPPSAVAAPTSRPPPHERRLRPLFLHPMVASPSPPIVGLVSMLAPSFPLPNSGNRRELKSSTTGYHRLSSLTGHLPVALDL